MTEDDKHAIETFVGDAQQMTLAALAQANAIAIARLAWHAGHHEKLRADLRAFLAGFKPDRPDDPAALRLHAMIEAAMRQMLLRLSEIPDLENPEP